MLDELVGFLWFRQKGEDDDDAGDRGRIKSIENIAVNMSIVS